MNTLCVVQSHKQSWTIHILRKLRVNKLNIDSGFLQVLNNEDLLSVFYSLCFQVFLMWIVFIMKNTQYIFKKKNIKLSNSAISKNPHSSHWMMHSFPLVSETPVVITVPTNSSGGGRQSQGSLQARNISVSIICIFQTELFSALELYRWLPLSLFP